MQPHDWMALFLMCFFFFLIYLDRDEIKRIFKK